MSNNFLNKNLTFIEKYNPELAGKIRAHNSLNANYEIIEAKSGDPILLRDGLAVHDDIDPIQEAIEIFSTVKNTSKKSILVVYGAGLGYLLRRAAKNHTGKIIIFEPDLDFLRILFEYTDCTDELSRGDLIIANTFEDIEEGYKKLFFWNYETKLAYLNYHKINCTKELSPFVQKLSSLHDIYQSNYRNLFSRSGIWTVSSISSASYTCKRNELTDIKDSLKGKTAVIISAGPSLEKNIELVKQHRDKLVVFCVGTALKKVLNYGIKPDFAVILECWESTQHQINDLDLSDINVIIQPMAFKALHSIKAKRFFNYFALNDNITSWLCSLWGIFTSDYVNKGTVSITALYSAKILGCNKIILIGQDLAFTGGQCYAKGTVYESLSHSDNETITVANSKDLAENMKISESQLQKMIDKKGKNLMKVKGQNEEFVWTSADYALFLKYFEQVVIEIGDKVRLINATEGGAYINGFEHITLDEAINQYTGGVVDVETVLEGVKPLDERIIKRRREVLLKELKTAEKIYKECELIINEATLVRQKFGNGTNIEINALFEENRPEFTSCLIKLKELYLKIAPKIESHILLHNYFIIKAMAVKNHIENFEDKNSYYPAFAKLLISYFVDAAQINTVLIPAVKEVMEEMEQEKRNKQFLLKT